MVVTINILTGIITALVVYITTQQHRNYKLSKLLKEKNNRIKQLEDEFDKINKLYLVSETRLKKLDNGNKSSKIDFDKVYFR
ncbi:MAG: hypothetical protein FPO08_03775 [Geobacter sp.]|nr:MAG: hypothetical protein FPO08_03775 [Geobacter sp.]